MTNNYMHYRFPNVCNNCDHSQEPELVDVRPIIAYCRKHRRHVSIVAVCDDHKSMTEGLTHG